MGKELKKRHVFIVGSKGIPARYGGFETFVDKLTEYHAEEKAVFYHVACKDAKEEFERHGARCFPVSTPKIGQAQAILYDVKAVKRVVEYIRKNEIEGAIVYVLACRIGPFFKKFVKEIHALSGWVFVNPDGHEWKRKKWSLLVRKYWKVSEKSMVKHADLVVCDSRNIEAYIKKEYAKYSPKTTFIPYGAERKKSDKTEAEFRLWATEKGLKKGDYYLVVGRFVPENNVEPILREFMRSKTEKKLAIVSNAHGKFLEELKRRTGFEKDDRVRFVGTVYDEGLLQKIRENAYAYLHGHEVGGTNPSLLEALAATKINLLSDVCFNREVGQDGALYWTKKEGSLSALIERADELSKEEIASLGERSAARIEREYAWEKVAAAYRDLFLGW